MFGRVAEGGVRVVDYDQGGNESDSAFRIRVPPGCSEMRSYIRTLVPSYAFAFKRPSLLVSHQSRVGNRKSAIANWNRLIPQSAMSLPLLPCSRAQRCSPAPLHLCTPAQTSSHVSLFPFHALRCHSAIRNPQCLFPCSLAPERSGAPLHPCTPAPLHLCTPAQTSSHVSLFTFPGFIPQSQIANLQSSI
jgi:hypothetical protein